MRGAGEGGGTMANVAAAGCETGSSRIVRMEFPARAGNSVGTPSTFESISLMLIACSLNFGVQLSHGHRA